MPTPATEWPAALGLAGVDAALAALRAGDGQALIDLVRLASAPCSTGVGLGGPPRCPTGTPDGTLIDYFPYFACDGWGSADAARARLTDDSTYPLVVLRWEPPLAPPIGDISAMSEAVVLVRGGFGEPDPESDARLLTTLFFNGDTLAEIIHDCGAYSESAFTTGDLPDIANDAEVLWRAYPTG